MRCVRAVTCLLLMIGFGFGVAAQEPTPVPQDQELSDRTTMGTPPTIPFSQPDMSQLSDEERERIERSRKLLPPGSSFSDFLDVLLTPKKYEKSRVTKIDDKYAYPHPAISIKMEIVKEEGDYIWLRGISPENPESPFHKMWNSWQVAELLTQDRIDNPRPDYFVDFEGEIVPPPYIDAFSFEPVSSGLPNRGRWQMNFAIADMNEDGMIDLVFPPERKGTPVPTIFLGQGDGRFEYWKQVSWPEKVPYDYGGIATGDFDLDGHLDVVLAIHFKSQYVLYGDGAGRFTRPQRLQSPDPRISSRAVTVADFDHDGRLDLAFLAEINYDQGTSARLSQASVVWILKNKENGWQLESDVLPKGKLIGDTILSPDIDGDTWPDLLLSSNTSDWRDLYFLNRGKDGWKRVGFKGVLSAAYHFDVDIGEKTGSSREIFATFMQFKRVHDQNQARTGVIFYPSTISGLETPGKPLVIAEKRLNPYQRLAAGDLNGDGLSDVVAGRKDGTIEVFVQLSPGNFYREKAPELAAPGRPFSIQLIDLNDDGLDDIIVSTVAQKKDSESAMEKAFKTTPQQPKVDMPGGVQVWLTRSGL